MPTCEVCSGPLPEYSGVGRRRRVCSTRCHQWRAAHGSEVPIWLNARVCDRCGEPLDGMDLRVRYCGARCAKRQASRSSVGQERACRYCDDSFTVTDGKQVYCSPGCRIKYNARFGSATNARRQAKRRGAILEGRFTLLDVARRDGWCCMLCFAPVDMEATDRYWQATIDHIVPVSAGGSHSFANVQLAHWTCNAAKRDSVDVITMSVPNKSDRRVIIRARSGTGSEVTGASSGTR